MGIQRIVDVVNEISGEFGMKMNPKRTKIMAVGKSFNVPTPIIVDGKLLEYVKQFKDIASWRYCKMTPDKEIKTRIEQFRNG